MNKVRRDKLRDITVKLLDISMDVDEIISDEQLSMDNVPDNLQESDRYSSMEDVVDALESAIEKIDEAKEYIYEAIDN